MSPSVAFAALLVGVVVWAVLARRLTAKPWEMQPQEIQTTGPNLPPAKIGLWILLAVMTSLFGLFISAYWMRMQHAHGDWSQLSIPRVLWLNTMLLLLSSAAMQWARAGVKLARPERVRIGFLVGGALALSFLAGQLLAWRDLSASGYFMTSGPASSFFYLLTGVHGLHLAGGLLVWGRTVGKITRPGAELIDVGLSVELCTVYWHFLMLVWLVLFALLLST